MPFLARNEMVKEISGNYYFIYFSLLFHIKGTYLVRKGKKMQYHVILWEKIPILFVHSYLEISSFFVQDVDSF